MLPTPVFLGFPGGSAGKESACNVGDLGSIPGLRDLLWRRAPAGGGLVAKSCRTLCNPSPWNSPGQNTGVGSLSLL